jgi:hypothetical protein
MRADETACGELKRNFTQELSLLRASDSRSGLTFVSTHNISIHRVLHMPLSYVKSKSIDQVICKSLATKFLSAQ